ncbi:glycosyltransferase family 4 protein [Desulfobulbus sp. US1]|nr:glycosyltransferase family 4 protein [Desulfobulbus sp. US4]MCW5208786.1 glycosyltransferase family 4 protein [Desulfobulbus sp. US1]
MSDRSSGAKQRFFGIYDELFKYLPEVEFVIFEPQDCQVGSWFTGRTNVSVRTTPLPSKGRMGKYISGLKYWPLELARESFTLFEAFHMPLVCPKRCKVIMTIHDLRGLHTETQAGNRALFKFFLYRALKEADHVITVSGAMRDEILAFFPQVTVSVIYNGFKILSSSQPTEVEGEILRSKYALPSEFVLAVGHFEPRKNYSRLIDAMALLKKNGIECPLVIIGNDSGYITTLSRRIKALNMTKQVFLLTGLTDHEVCCMYKLCSLFVFPSLYEGFGIPIIEAMAARRPMVLSDLPVFREITEDQAIYFPHDDVAAIADAIETGLASTHERNRIVHYGSRRVGDFSFERLAKKVACIYRSLT